VTHPLVVAALVTAATWSSWRWYAERISEAPEEGAALVLTITFLAIAGRLRSHEPAARASVPLLPSPLLPVPLLPVALLLAVYAAGHAFLPPIARAALAVAATLFAWHIAFFKDKPPVAFWGLAALALPVVPSLQFTLGYPMRVVSAALTVALLQAHGFVIARQGTFLVWRDEMVQFDAPCSGVNMLWAGLMLTLMGCTLFRLSATKVLLAVALSTVLTIGCNVLRASSLFYVESGFIPQAPAWWHEGIGLAAFALSSLATLWLLLQLSDRKVPSCAT
jgi:exosortase/archaeosortase family protein